ncbi:RNA-directed DNA polymerase [Mycolicibacterium sp. ND9-15]|uniref:RNA-directed DNA polymerase n=1 Tax=Mycolicibacterium sp. ND9-15 TaxID=3042320 RepID=UPI002DDB1630|nr:RNA-directed DNA polymerase [Mycolicibacterium sp. ND9-15]WSE54829.1 RNA-directed DNA polymerase [Mycolicibacterium sp. ND9-15]
MATFGLELESARQLSAMELYGDWYRDPWGWPEVLTVEFVAKLDAEGHLGIDKRSVSTSLDPFFHRMEVPKSYLGVRPAVVQDPMSRLAYNAAVLKGVGTLHSDLPTWVYGWRLRDDKISKNKREWAAYVESLPTVDDDGHGLVTDITSFFASIELDRLLEIVGAAAGKTIPREIIAAVVDAHSRMLGRSGLPQRSFASAILANCYLQPIDDALNAAIGNWDLDIVGVRRWMDDISAEGPEESLYGLLLELQDRARHIGLELNSAKTHLTDASETAKDLRSETLNTIEVEFRKMKLSEYTDEEVDVAVNADVLTSLEREILDNPDGFGRPVIRSVLHSLTEYGIFDNSAEWRRIAHRVPHVADNLGRYLRGSMDAAWFGSEVTDCVNWFTEYVASTWGRQNWVTSQFALAFDDNTSPRVREVLARWLDSSTDLQQVAIAAERMSAMDQSYARYVMRSRADGTSDPLLLRVFALGLLRTKADRGTVAAVLERDKRNGLLAHYLETRNWEPPPVAGDFGGSDDAPG